MKIALISPSLPPDISGQAIVLLRLFENIDAADYCFISSNNYSKTSGRLPCNYYYLPPLIDFKRGYKLGIPDIISKINSHCSEIETKIRCKQYIEIINFEKCDAMVVCTGDLTSLYAAYKACQYVKIPLYVYVFDDYYYQFTYENSRRFAQKVEKEIYEFAKTIIVTNESMYNEIFARYGIKSSVIHNCCDLSLYSHDFEQVKNDEKVILYTGSIYEAQADAIRNLLDAIKKLNRDDIKLHIYSMCTMNNLNKYGISGHVVIHKPVSPLEMAKIQQNADILFLPLAFESDYHELIKTASPGKLGEYLAANRPILANIPPDSFISYYFDKYKCGLYVDKPEPLLLAEAINELLTNEESCNILVENAWNRANIDFSVNTAQARFKEIINWDTQNQCKSSG